MAEVAVPDPAALDAGGRSERQIAAGARSAEAVAEHERSLERQVSAVRDASADGVRSPGRLGHGAVMGDQAVADRGLP